MAKFPRLSKKKSKGSLRRLFCLPVIFGGFVGLWLWVTIVESRLHYVILAIYNVRSKQKKTLSRQSQQTHSSTSATSIWEHDHTLEVLHGGIWGTPPANPFVQEMPTMLAKTFRQMMTHSKPPGGLFAFALKPSEALSPSAKRETFPETNNKPHVDLGVVADWIKHSHCEPAAAESLQHVFERIRISWQALFRLQSWTDTKERTSPSNMALIFAI